METEMEFSDGEQSNANTHVAVSQFSAPPAPSVYNRTGLMAVYGNTAIGSEKGMERRHDHEQQLPGYVFMCNARTKIDCFRYRVFGIPKGRKEVVESIIPGMKLFLYDFEKRLLYGVYEATIGGKLDIEPEAFDRMYPAQVGFRIVKNCYPLPENTFKSVIYENYKGAKFKQELSPRQVMSLLSLFRPFSAPELDSLPHRLASRDSAPRTLSFEERFIAATQLRNASTVFDPLSGRHAEPKLGSLMPHQSVVPRTSLLQHSYSRQDDYTTNPVREALSLSNLNQPYHHPTEPRQQRLLGDPSRSSIQDPQLKYLTILSNIRRYGSAPERPASENEYHPATPSEKDQYSENKYYPSTLSGNEHPSVANGSVYRSEFYNTSASQKEGEASQQHEILGGTYYHPETSTVLNTTVAMQPESEMQAVSVAQSYTETAPAHAHGAAPQPGAGAIGYTNQPQSVAGNYTTHSQPGSVEEITQSYAGTGSYTQEQYYAAMAHTSQLYAGGSGYTQQPHEIAYAQQPHAAATAYAQQPHAAATGYAQQPHAAATAYAQQPHAAATVYTHQPYAVATGYAQAVGYTPQYHAQAAGYAQQAVPQGSATGTTTDWLAASQAYSATREWNALNQSSYYPHTADAKTTYNQTS